MTHFVKMRFSGKQGHDPCNKYTPQLNPNEQSKNTNGPQSPAALKWAGDRKNLRVWGKGRKLEYWKHSRKRYVKNYGRGK